MPFDPKNVNICDHVVTSRKAGQHVGFIHLSAEISFHAESFGKVPEFLAENFGSKCHFGT